MILENTYLAETERNPQERSLDNEKLRVVQQKASASQAAILKKSCRRCQLQSESLLRRILVAGKTFLPGFQCK